MGIQIVNVSKTYHMGAIEVSALNGVSLEIAAGELVAVMGPSGSGKSTLMNILGCLDVPSTGRYLFAGDDGARRGEGELAHVRNRRIGFVFQQFHLLSSMSAWRNVELPLLYRTATDRRATAMEAPNPGGLSHPV